MATVQKHPNGNGATVSRDFQLPQEPRNAGALVNVPNVQHLLGEVNRSTQAFLMEANQTTQSILHEVAQLMRDCAGDVRVSETYTNVIEPDGTRKMIVQREFNLSKDPPV